MKCDKPSGNYSLDEMIGHLKNPRGKRSLEELDTVVDEIIARNPEWVAELNKVIKEIK